MNAPFLIPGLLPGELVIDSFAGGGTLESIRRAARSAPSLPPLQAAE